MAMKRLKNRQILFLSLRSKTPLLGRRRYLSQFLFYFYIKLVDSPGFAQEIKFKKTLFGESDLNSLICQIDRYVCGRAMAIKR